MSNQNENPEKSSHAPDGGEERGRIEIALHNEDNGRPYTIHGGPGTHIDEMIRRAYEQLGVSRQADDRLRCDGGGSVFDHGSMKLADYVENVCTCKTWLFAAGTGGA